MYTAHIRLDEHDHPVYQSAADHSAHCAEYAARAVPILANAARLAGLVHDMGKYTDVFQKYIEDVVIHKRVLRRGSVNHSFAGVRFILERYWKNETNIVRKMTAECIAFACGSHHGLFDAIGEQYGHGFTHRLEQTGIGYEEAVKNYDGATMAELDELFEKACAEISGLIPLLAGIVKESKEQHFHVGLIARMLLSAVIDGDRRDTAEFMHTMTLPRPKDTDWNVYLNNLEKKLATIPQDSEMARVRGIISERCRRAAQLGEGIFRLSVPTGGGKTLAVTRYALALAAQEQKKRIIFVTPLLTVLDQNAQVIREYIDQDSIILEHHSNVVREAPQGEVPDQNEWLTETWDAPFIITTLVQLLNTLFSGKGSCIRRMSALADSVIIFDEVQSLPTRMITMFNMAMNFLSTMCRASVVLCSATHPCLETVNHALRYHEPPELVPDDPELYQVFRRTEIHNLCESKGWEMEKLADRAIEEAEKQRNLLLICNKKTQASELYHRIRSQTAIPVFHLSTAMCARHRMDCLAAVQARLDAKLPVICVATQLVEAGVDFSFGCVIRLLAGLDSVVQAAGRCNRHGEYGCLCPVYIVNLKGEDLSRLPDIRVTQYAAQSVLAKIKNAGRLNIDTTSPNDLNRYYERLYEELADNKTDYPLILESGTADTMYRLLSDNGRLGAKYYKARTYFLNQAFKTAGKLFCVFDDDTIDVIVPYAGTGAPDGRRKEELPLAAAEVEDGRSLIADLCSEAAHYDFARRKDIIRKAKNYTISLYAYQIKQLEARGGLYKPQGWEDAVYILQEGFYTPETGFAPEGDADVPGAIV